jgi:hypothetical protein
MGIQEPIWLDVCHESKLLFSPGELTEMKHKTHSCHGRIVKPAKKVWCCALVLTACVSLSYGQSAGPGTSKPAVAHPTDADLVELNSKWRGIWEMKAGQSDFSNWKSLWDWSGGKAKARNPPPLTSKWQKIYDDIRAKAVQGENVADFTAACVPYGFPSITFFPEEFQFTRDSLNILSWGNSAYRHVYMDGRGHPRQPTLSYNGHSVGHWDSGTLVIDTVGFRTDSLIDTGLTHSSQLHTVERIRVFNSNEMEVEFTFADPQVFVHPWVVKRTYEKVTQVQISAAPDCADNRFEQGQSGETIMLDSTGKPLTPTTDK